MRPSYAQFHWSFAAKLPPRIKARLARLCIVEFPQPGGPSIKNASISMLSCHLRSNFCDLQLPSKPRFLVQSMRYMLACVDPSLDVSPMPGALLLCTGLCSQNLTAHIPPRLASRPHHATRLEPTRAQGSEVLSSEAADFTERCVAASAVSKASA